jgi:hypothetical protein
MIPLQKPTAPAYPLGQAEHAESAEFFTINLRGLSDLGGEISFL